MITPFVDGDHAMCDMYIYIIYNIHTHGSLAASNSRLSTTACDLWSSNPAFGPHHVERRGQAVSPIKMPILCWTTAAVTTTQLCCIVLLQQSPFWLSRRQQQLQQQFPIHGQGAQVRNNQDDGLLATQIFSSISAEGYPLVNRLRAVEGMPRGGSGPRRPLQPFWRATTVRDENIKIYQERVFMISVTNCR
jgi:hypothetical protein